MERRQRCVIRGTVLPKPPQSFIVVLESRSARFRPRTSALSHDKIMHIPQKGKIQHLWLLEVMNHSREAGQSSSMITRCPHQECSIQVGKETQTLPIK